jgi:hypothetical protein
MGKLRSAGAEFWKTDVDMIAAVLLCAIEAGISTPEDCLEISRIGVLELGDAGADRYNRSDPGCGMRDAERDDALTYPLGCGLRVFQGLLGEHD